MRPILLLAAAVAVTLPLTAQAQTNPPQTLRIGIADDADTLDPTLSRTLVGRFVFASLCDKLVDIDAKLNIVPQLAASYSWIDSKTLEFKLRPDMKFHDLTPVDAEAVKFSLERHLTMAGSTRKGEIGSLDHVEVVDPLTVRLVLKAPNSPFLAQLSDRSGMIVSPKAALAAGANFGQHPVCAGPFKFTERVPQDRIVVDRFAEYWDAGNVHVNRVVYQPIVDATIRLANLRAGTLEMAERIAPTDIAQVKADPKLRAEVFDGLGYQSLSFNIGNGKQPRTAMMRDAKVRQAFAAAIDRQAINDVVYNGLFTPIAQGVPPASPFYAPDIKPAGRDVALAKKLLAEAGVKTPLAVELMITNSADQRQTGEVIQSMALEAGFDVKLRATEFVTALKAQTEGDYEVFLIGWSGRADADGNMYNFLHTGASLNDAHYSSAVVDSLLEQTRAETDVAVRRGLYGKIATQLNLDLPVMYIYSPKVLIGMSAKITGFTPIADGLIRIKGLKMGQ
jgi:peptide/nickel transport system substrate-binding protein